MRPLDDVFSSSSSPSARPKSSITSRSPSPGLRLSSTSGGHGNGTAGGAGSTGGMTFFLTEENNFGVHSMSESHVSSRSISRSPPLPTPAISSPTDAEIIEKPEEEAVDNPDSFEADSGVYTESSKKTANMPESNAGPTISALPSHIFERRHINTPSIGSNISPTISTPSSPQHNLSSSAISDDSELDICSHHGEENTPSDSISSSFPQLVMPRVNVPCRKAFTERGRTLGKLKIMVVGDSGIGKSSLIQAILQTSVDIVHYDPPQPAMSSTSSSSSSFTKPSLSRRGTLELNVIPPTENILEIKASTRAYPSWWKSEAERETKSSRPQLTRRESVGEVLERNICFVDTPGYGSSDDFNDVLARVSGYIEENYDKVNSMLNSTSNHTNDLLSLFSNGINCVDLVIYVVLHRLKPVDITIMRQLSTLTNVIPVIAKSDSLSHTQTLTLKLSLLRDLRANSIPIFTFGKSISELERNVVNGIPWAVSCLRDDTAEMDASLLMRDEVVESYVESDLSCVIHAIVENASWVRFAATKKFLEWRMKRIDSELSLTISPSQSAMSIIPIPSMADGYAMARVGDHIDREERLARVRLVQWAGDMRRTVRRKMQEEREEFERVEHQDRVKWLVTRLNEAITTQQESSLVPVTTTQLIRRSSTSRKRRQTLDRDPLGIVWIQERWGPRVSKSIVWIVEAGVVLGSGWVVWKYVVDSGLSGWFLQNARTA